MLIFIAGVHGVGKGYLCSFAKEEFEVTHVSASELIKNNSQLTFNSSKLTATPDKNQIILLTALNELTSKKQNIVLDGHFTLINAKGEVEELKPDIFEKMSLDGVILIEESDETIRERVMLRDRTQITYNLGKLIETERKNAIYITEMIDAPLIILKSPTKDEFLIALEKLGMVKKHAQSKL
ncbi:TPA: AAA family ATPase [Klebsiella pneumoniae subsp. pneumoniae]|uniref:ATP-binding protein n=1 Tax=Klebsiella pneumoniae TaxID=573 RepID=UPI00103449F5|nr:ATP-binding protein [Klebsiella pneumoniae]HDT1001885.1 AAA family ATPase [Klebsiella pneumoniae subsp. pneumoniae]